MGAVWIHTGVTPTTRQGTGTATAVVDLPLNQALDWLDPFLTEEEQDRLLGWHPSVVFR